MKKTNMYSDVKTWNPFIGCKFDCRYCRQSFQRMVKRVYFCQGSTCIGCRDFSPHNHPDRLDKLPGGQILWPCAHGDITFADPAFMKTIIKTVNAHAHRYEEIYWQSKNPACLRQYLSLLPENSTLLTTVETNRDENYRQISKAPLPSKRVEDFASLPWPRKMITIEPAYDFDVDEMVKILHRIKPVGIWIGYNSKNPRALGLNEPSNKKISDLIAAARKMGIGVRTKTIRPAFTK